MELNRKQRILLSIFIQAFIYSAFSLYLAIREGVLTDISAYIELTALWPLYAIFMFNLIGMETQLVMEIILILLFVTFSIKCPFKNSFIIRNTLFFLVYTFPFILLTCGSYHGP